MSSDRVMPSRRGIPGVKGAAASRLHARYAGVATRRTGPSSVPSAHSSVLCGRTATTMVRRVLDWPGWTNRIHTGWIFDADQKQAARRRRRSTFACGREQRVKLSLADVSLAGFQQCSNHIPHHVLQKPAPTHAINQPAPLRSSRTEHRPHFGSPLRVTIVGRGKSREIVLAFENGASACMHISFSG